MEKRKVLQGYSPVYFAKVPTMVKIDSILCLSPPLSLGDDVSLFFKIPAAQTLEVLLASHQLINQEIQGFYGCFLELTSEETKKIRTLALLNALLIRQWLEISQEPPAFPDPQILDLTQVGDTLSLTEEFLQKYSHLHTLEFGISFFPQEWISFIHGQLKMDWLNVSSLRDLSPRITSLVLLFAYLVRA